MEWLIPLKAKLLSNMPEWKPSCFIIDDASQKLQVIWWMDYFIFIFFNSFSTCLCLHIHVSKCVYVFLMWKFCACIRLCGIRIMHPFPFAHGMFWKHGIHYQWIKSKTWVHHALSNDLHKVMYMFIHLNETIESFKGHWKEKVVDNFEWHKFNNHGLNIFGFIIVNLVCKFIFNYLPHTPLSYISKK